MHILNKALNLRMVDPGVIFIDGTHIKASTNKKSSINPGSIPMTRQMTHTSVPREVFFGIPPQIGTESAPTEAGLPVAGDVLTKTNAKLAKKDEKFSTAISGRNTWI
ncbi:MAG: hypothetical protein LUE21_07555 [Oscillospiraceae bacterium]|nr:hypothetical protein [Oscillospiraceae bacterium]